MNINFYKHLNPVLVQIREATLDCPNRGKAASATAKALEDLGRLQRTLGFAKGATFEACVEEASGRFYSLFRDRVLQLVHNFPEVCGDGDGDGTAWCWWC